MVVLEDHVQASLHHLIQAQARLQSLDLSETPESFQVMQLSLLTDISFLVTSLENTADYLRTCQEQIKTFTAMKSSQTAGIMSLLVAVYVPFAGVAGYLGMNTAGIVDGDLPQSTFWIAAIPLTIATILIPLSATVLARITLAATFSTRVFTIRKWPLIVDWAVILMVIGMVVAHVINWRTATDGWFVNFFRPISPHEATITGSVFTGLELFKVVEHIFQRNKRAKKWFVLFSSNFTVCLLCTVLSTVDTTPATLVIPPCFVMFVTFVRPLLF
jgi:hypothetical protein